MIEAIGRAIDPEAFSDGIWQRGDLSFEEKAALAARRDALCRQISSGMMSVADRYKVVDVRMADIRGDYYQIDGGGGGRSLKLNAASLGRFLLSLLSLGGDCVSLFAMSAKYRNSHVAALVRLPPKNRAAFEEETGLALREPTRLSVD